ncbi:MAG: recombinase A [Polyangiaceae bacterium]|nr:recombinase A [Polyangiaceae bacterium]
MALPARLLEQLPPQVVVGERFAGVGSREGASGLGHAALAAAALPLGIGPLDVLLPDGGVPRGAVTELSLVGGAAFGTSLVLAACRSAQEQSRLRGGELAWCAFVDPTSSLHAPAVTAAGVRLERLLVVRPPLEALSRVAVRLAESQVFAVVVIDLVGVPGATVMPPLKPSVAFGRAMALGKWARVVRRLALATASTDTCVLLLTAEEAPRPVPLPVALRVELRRLGRYELGLRVAKDRRGRLSGPHKVKLVPGFQPPEGVSCQQIHKMAG